METSLERMLVVLFPDWPVVVHCQAVGTSSIIIERQCVLAMSRAAREHGVHIGQRRRDAERLSPGVQILERDRAREIHSFEPIVRTLQAIAPSLTVGEAGWIGIPTRGPARYFGGEHALIAVIDQALCELMYSQEMDYTWKVGIAEGFFGATLAAQRECVVEVGKTDAFLAPLPISLIENASLSELLERLGITTLGDFVELPIKDVLGRFGMDGFCAYQLAGAKRSPRYTDRHEVEEITVMENFDEPIGEIEVLENTGVELGERFGEVLRTKGFRCTICEVSFVCSDGRSNVRLWQHRYGWDARSIAQRVHWQLLAWHEQTNSEDDEDSASVGVIALSICAKEIIDQQGSQLGLWDRPRTHEEEMERVCVRLEGLLGQGMVMQAQLVGGRGPLERVEYLSFGRTTSSKTRGLTPPWPGQLPSPNPTLIFREEPEIMLSDQYGVALNVDRRGTLHGEPAKVGFSSGRAARVAGWSSPWLVDERWWDRRRATRRARLQVLLEDQRVLLIAWSRGGWRLEGQYD
jgi:protein ImuB